MLLLRAVSDGDGYPQGRLFLLSQNECPFVRVLNKEVFMAAKEKLTIVLACTECKNKNYYYLRGKKKEFKIELNKFCRACGKSTKHKEGKAS